MALSATTLQFLLQQLRKCSLQGFTSIPKQIFNYLADEIKDNSVYVEYENKSQKWVEWLNLQNFKQE